MPKYTGEDGVIIDTGDLTVQQIQEEAARLRKHSETLLGEKKAESTKRTQLEQELAAIGEKTALQLKERDDQLATLSESLKGSSAKVDLFKQTVADLAVNGPAIELANNLTTAPDLALPHIRARLSAEVDEATGKAVTKVLDKAGKPSELTLEDLMKELAADTKLAPIIKGSRARGSGNGGNQGNASAGGAGNGKGNVPIQQYIAERKAARAASN